MNRRSFLTNLLKSAAGFSILPSAVTYARHWKATAAGVLVNPAWVNAEYEGAFIVGPPVWTWETAPANEKWLQTASESGKGVVRWLLSDEPPSHITPEQRGLLTTLK